jgi:hypothetical protein
VFLADTPIQQNVIIRKEEYMNNNKMQNEEMIQVIGGAITFSWINALSKAVSTIYELGERTGSTIRRIVTGKYCSVR